MIYPPFLRSFQDVLPLRKVNSFLILFVCQFLRIQDDIFQPILIRIQKKSILFLRNLTKALKKLPIFVRA